LLQTLRQVRQALVKFGHRVRARRTATNLFVGAWIYLRFTAQTHEFAYMKLVANIAFTRG